MSQPSPKQLCIGTPSTLLGAIENGYAGGVQDTADHAADFFRQKLQALMLDYAEVPHVVRALEQFMDMTGIAPRRTPMELAVAAVQAQFTPTVDPLAGLTMKASEVLLWLRQLEKQMRGLEDELSLLATGTAVASLKAKKQLHELRFRTRQLKLQLGLPVDEEEIA